MLTNLLLSSIISFKDYVARIMSQLVLQIIAGVNVLVCIFILMRLVFDWGQPHMKYLGCLALMIAINAISYYFEVSADSQETAWAATKIEYFVAPCLGGFSLLFSLDYTRFNVRRPALLFGFFIIPVIITLAVVIEPLTHFYVREMAYLPAGNVRHLVFLETGPLYIVNFAYNFGLDLIISVLVCLRFFRRNRRNWYHCIIFLICLWLPAVSRIFLWTGIFPEIDTFYVASTVSITLLYWYVKGYRQPEWYNLGWDAVIKKFNEAVLVVNADMEIVNVNPVFFQFFPAFRRADTATDTIRLPQFIEYVKDQMVDSIPTTIFDDLTSFGPDYSEGEFTIIQDYLPAIPRGGLYDETPETELDPARQTFTLIRHTIKAKDRILGQTIVLSDVSSYRNMIGEIVLLKQKAEEASQSKSEFLATMSHEIRTPLNAIIGIAEILLQKKQDAETYADLERIQHSGSGLLGIVNDVLDISKIETGNLELIPVDYMVSSMVNDAVQLNIVRIGSKPIMFELDIDETTPAKLYGDELRVRQILNNLLSNAIKYTQEGKVALKIRWTAGNNDEGIVNIQVSDTGQGIKEEDMGKLFSQYGQINARANRNIEGTGLGLSITKNLVEMMQGTVHVESKYGRGSIFAVTIRQRVADSTPLGRETALNLKHFRFIENRSVRDKKLISVSIPDGKILVVDEVETNLYVARGLLLPYGITIDCVKSGQEAIDRIRSILPSALPSENRPETVAYDLVFMDHMMPGMDGIETTGIIRAMNTEYTRTLPIIALTANAIAGIQNMFLEKGFNDYLSKPISRSKLDEILVQWMPREKQQKAGGTGGEQPGGSSVPAGDAPVKGEREIEGLNVDQGIATAGGSQTAYHEILAIFCKDVDQRLATLGRVPVEAELLAFTTNVHALKSAAANIGATAVSQKAAALEDAGKRGDLAAIEAKLGDFRGGLEVLIQKIRAAREPEKSNTAEEAEEEQEISGAVQAEMKQLRKALEEGEIRVIDTLLKQFKERRLTSRLRQAVVSLSDHVLLSEFDEAITVIDDLLRS
jgi:signal transduction histidine kinase/DNA-binding response OmpR family regulator